MANYSSLAVGLLLTATFSACSSDQNADLPAGMVTRNSFESVQGWGGANEVSITSAKAHSGKYAIWVNPQVEYSYTYSSTLNQMTPAKPKRLTLEGWAWVPDKQSTASVVLEIKHSPTNGSTVYYGGLDLSSSVGGYKDWKKVSKTFVLPDSIASGNALKIYMWRGSNQTPVYLDDVSISLEN